MLIANVVVLVIIIGTAAYQYLQGTLVRSAIMLATALCSLIPAFAYYETLANVLISRGKMVPWAQPVCFAVLFILVFAILQAIVDQIINIKIELPGLVDKIGRAVCGALLGLVLSGLALTAAQMGPLGLKYPYPRLASSNPDLLSPQRPLLSADGFVTGLFAHASSGSMSGRLSFAAVHPNLLNELFLNRLKDAKDLFFRNNVISVPAKAGVWAAGGGLRDTEGQVIEERSGHTIMFVRVTFGGADITTAQIRLICTDRNLAGERLDGKGVDAYPLGLAKGNGQVEVMSIGQKLPIGQGRSKWDLAFYVPDGYLPAAIAMKRNNIAAVSLPASAEDIEQVEESEKAQPAEEEPVSEQPAPESQEQNESRPDAEGSEQQ